MNTASRSSAARIADRVCRIALEIAKHRAEADPKDVQKQRDLSIPYNRLGRAILVLGHTEKASEQFDKNLAISRKLAADHPMSVEIQQALADACSDVGDVNARLGQTESAKQFFRQTESARKLYEDAVEIRSKLARDDPKNVFKQLDLSGSYVRLGLLDRDRRHLKESRKWFDSSVEILRALDKGNPGNVRIKRSLAISLNHLGYVNLARDRREESLELLQEGVEICRSLVETDSDNAKTTGILSVLLCTLGRANLSLGHIDTALRPRSEITYRN